jgi:hypothetical protein
VDAGSCVGGQTVSGEYENDYVREMRARWEGEGELGGRDSDEVCETWSICWDEAEHRDKEGRKKGL